MTLNNVYNYIRKYIDRDFSKRFNIIIFNDFDVALCNAYPAQSHFFETTLDRVLDILIMQDTLVNDDIEILNEFIN